MSDADNQNEKSNPAATGESAPELPPTPAPTDVPAKPPEPQTITLSVNLNIMFSGFDTNINACLPELAKTVRKLKKIEGVEASSLILTVINKDSQIQNRYQILVGSKKKPNGQEDFQVLPL